MRCLKCGRALTRFAFSVETAEGLKGWGPQCAQEVGLKAPKKARAKAAEPVRDTRTRDWVEEFHGAAA